jgi:RimJ/RimL family protein N-acetyltransferase
MAGPGGPEGVHLNHLTNTLTWRLRCGTDITMRPVTPGDATGLGALMGRLSPGARRNRFHGAVHAPSADQLRFMSCVDQQRHVAFVMTTTIDDRPYIVGDVRYVVDRFDAALDGERSAEFAVVVDERWQRQGLGEHAMLALMATARSAGLGWLHGDVLAQNAAMLSLMRRCRFCCSPDRNDDALVHAETSLAVEWRHPRPFGHALMDWMPPRWTAFIDRAVRRHA